MSIKIQDKLVPANSSIELFDISDIAYDDTESFKNKLDNHSQEIINARDNQTILRERINSMDSNINSISSSYSNQSDWSQNTTTENDYVKNKPNLSNYALASDLNTLSSTVDNLKIKVDQGKSKVADAITEMGVTTSGTDSYQIIADNIRNIETTPQIINVTSFSIINETGLTNDNYNFSMYVGQRRQLTYTIEPDNATDKTTKARLESNDSADGEKSSAITDMGLLVGLQYGLCHYKFGATDGFATDNRTWDVYVRVYDVQPISFAENATYTVSFYSDGTVGWTYVKNAILENGTLCSIQENKKEHDATNARDIHYITLQGSSNGLGTDTLLLEMSNESYLSIPVTITEASIYVAGDFEAEDYTITQGRNVVTADIQIPLTTETPTDTFNTCVLVQEGTDTVLAQGLYIAKTIAMFNKDNGLKDLAVGSYKVYIIKGAGSFAIETGAPRSSTFTLTVEGAKVATINPTTMTIDAGNTGTFTIENTSSTIASITYSNDCLATQSGIGQSEFVVLANKGGNCTITVTLNDGTVLTAQVTITGSTDPTLTGIDYPASKQALSGVWDALGDSLTIGYGVNESKRYTSLVQNSVTGLTANNYGVTGSCIATNTGSSQLSFVERYSSMDTSASLITVFGGVNDFLMSVSIGTIDDTSTDTFYGAMNALVSGLKANYPTARIVFFTPIKIGGMDTNTNQAWNVPNNAGHDMKAYRNAIVTVCNKNQIEVLDLFILDELDCLGTQGDTYYRKAEGDYTHLNANGHQFVADYIKDNMIQ